MEIDCKINSAKTLVKMCILAKILAETFHFFEELLTTILIV